MVRGPGTGFNGNELNEPDLSDDDQLENPKLEFPEFLEPDALARLVDDKVPTSTVILDIPICEPFRPCYIMNL
jgi:hypothetical protein